MTTELLVLARKQYLSSLNDPEASSELLADLLAQAVQQSPELIVAFQPGSGKDALDPDSISWDDKYFSRHLLLAEHNFARERIEHLLAVREHLRRLGVKGFVPTGKPSSSQTQSAQDVTTNYAPSANLKNFVDEGDLLTIRTALRLELNDNCLTAADLRAALAWTNSQVVGALEPYAEKAFARGMEADRAHWTTEYYDQQGVYLKTNFAKERFLHLIEVRDHLRHQGVDGFEPVALKPRASSQPNPAVAGQAFSQRQPDLSQHARPQASAAERNPAFKAALLIGGALAALVVFLVALVK
ncbi:hypothetical protein [Pseudomonas putida]|uniref:hypothetical protein n=1 Tax=Pseudomonas putida TaxID=303 RepID=UPI001E63DF08|nr:hypothetical protein [Pseudomonas putida]